MGEMGDFWGTHGQPYGDFHEVLIRGLVEKSSGRSKALMRPDQVDLQQVKPASANCLSSQFAANPQKQC
eukprot:1143173-Pelagomonas_calceolata.AAC.1